MDNSSNILIIQTGLIFLIILVAILLVILIWVIVELNMNQTCVLRVDCICCVIHVGLDLNNYL